MAINAQELAWFVANYTAVTGKAVQRFVCPITLRDDENAELSNGHVLNAALHTASRKTVIQRKDVDGYFGRTIEPLLIDLLNLPMTTPQELLRRVRNWQLTTPQGEQVELFFSDRRAQQRFQQAGVFDGNRNLVATPFLRDPKLIPSDIQPMQVSGSTFVPDGVIEGCLLKSAYLALFQRLGYSFVFNPLSSDVRVALAKFYQDGATPAEARDYFQAFNGCWSVVTTDESIPNTLEDGAVLVHTTGENASESFQFAISCLFRINGKLISVALPSCLPPTPYSEALERYQAYLRDQTISQKTQLVPLAAVDSN
ncbi:hypothetical protein [Lacipirellula sp.]|uniref:hypothetical protein n=1 Tax=Lacipirellula sp. TaxID=2691419 RepID=UPI003D11E83D